MNRAIATSLCVLGLMAGHLRAELTVYFPPLAQPLKLPPGLVETLPLNHDASMFGDSLRAVDCANDADLPYGICGDQLFGGLAMTDSHLTGNITIQFFPPINNVSHFAVQQHVMRGDDGVLSAPVGYAMPVKGQQISDTLQLSSGDLDLTTGGVTNLSWNVFFSNTALLALANVNPKLKAPVINFPGVRGHAWATFHQRPDGLLDFRFRGETFLPLGKAIEGQPVRFPMPFCDPEAQCASILARGTSLHPHLYLDTAPPLGTECANNCPDIPTDTVQEFTVASFYTNFGDNFDLDLPQLGGLGPGRSHLQGRLGIQFGPREGNTVSFTLANLVPSALFATPPVSNITGPGFQPGLIGQQEFLKFPKQTYFLKRVALIGEPYGLIHGAIDLRTGRVIGEMEYPILIAQSLAEALFAQNAGRISTDPFFLIASQPQEGEPESTYALFQKGVNGQTVFRYSGEHRRSFATFRFPSPDLIFANSYVAGPAAKLDIFTRVQAAHPVDNAKIVKSGSGSFLSSIGDSVSYNFSIPCNQQGVPGTFTYTNNNSGVSGGTFTLKNLASVSCTNSANSVAGPGDYDTINFSGFGSWSKDASDALPRFSTVSISLAPGAPYTGILVYQNPDAETNVVLSGANNPPATVVLP